jgi:hypothetical protein
MAELRDELAAVQRETVSTAEIQRAVALFDPGWDLLLVPERFRILHLLLESVVYDGATGEFELAFYFARYHHDRLASGGRSGLFRLSIGCTATLGVTGGSVDTSASGGGRASLVYQ